MEKMPEVLAVGSVLWDVIGIAGGKMALAADVPGRIRRQPGGVAMNIATALAGHGLGVALLSVVGRDSEGDALIRAAVARGLITRYLLRSDDLPTDRYIAIEAENGLIAAIADAHSLEQAGSAILAPLLDGRLASAENPWRGMVALDGNLTTAMLSEIASAGLFDHADLRIAPASPGKASRLGGFLGHARATIYLNLHEANILTGGDFHTSQAAAQALLGFGLYRVAVTNGPAPATIASAVEFADATPPAVRVLRLTGAGDCFMAAHMAAEHRGMATEAALHSALGAAAEFISHEEP
ncbi:MAG: kinase [Rhodobacteraceae bacterium]|nr:kinase [Paracoccaceae bacterium]